MTGVVRMARADTLRLEAPAGLGLRTPCKAVRQEKHMQIGFNAPTSGVLIEPDSLTRIITEGEALGFDYVTISDHIMVSRHLDSKYPYTNTGDRHAGSVAGAVNDHCLYRRVDPEAALRALGHGGAAPTRGADRQAAVHD
jgi:hypothetical protein